MSTLTVTATPPAPGLLKRTGEACLDVAKDPLFFGTQASKLTIATLSWKEVFEGPLSPAETQVRAVARTGKSVLGAAGLPRSCVDTGLAVIDLYKNPSPTSAKGFVSKVSSVGGPLGDAIALVKEVYAKLGASAPTWLTNFAGVLPVTLLTGFGITLYDKVGNIVGGVGQIFEAKPDQARTPDEKAARERLIMNVLAKSVKTLSELVMAVSYIAFGVLLLSAFFFGAVVAPWTLVCSTIALTCTIFNKFYGKIVVDHLPADPTRQEMGLPKDKQ